jgi:hypothetical protein
LIVIPGRCEASNPESRDSPGRNCAPEVRTFDALRNDQQNRLRNQRNREPPMAGFSPKCPVQMLAPQTRSGALWTPNRPAGEKLT